VQFADFWMGDQLCSLVYTLSNLYMFVCIYVKNFQNDWQQCGSPSKHWPVAFALAALPFLIRLIQSIKRYADSGLFTHLINGGKYSAGIVYYFFYYLWRHQETHYDPLFTPWLIFTFLYSVYAACWDLLMDWSLLKPRTKHFLLRDDLGYSSHVYSYYFAIITNCLIRFAWVFYIPEEGPSMLIRTFIVGLLEMLRRVQWNFYRLENEHLGNMDQYRVTREVPLPYTFDHRHHVDDDEDSEPHSPGNKS
ncbi:Protein SYG1, partial [Leucoagaricus sp. SymC.cos]